MTAITTGRSQPAKTPGLTTNRPRVPVLTPSIDPIRVIRRHWLGLVVSIILGVVLGTITHFACLFIYPLYSGEVLFELQPGLQDPTQIGTSDIIRDDLIERLARTQTVLLLSREVLQRAMENPDITRSTQWHLKFVSPDGVFDLQEAVDELEEDLRAPVIRGTNLFAIRWSTHRKNDVPIVLNAITAAYQNKRKTLDETSIANNMRVFNSQLLETGAALRDIAGRIQQFIIEHALTTRDDPRFGPVAQSLGEIIQKTADARESLSISQSRLIQVTMKIEGTLEPDFDDRQKAENHPLILSLNNAMHFKRTRLRELSDKFHSDHPEVGKMQSEVRAAEEERDAALDDMIRQDLEASRIISANEIESLITLLEQFEEEAEEKDTLLRELTADHSEYVAMETEREQLEEERSGHKRMINELSLMRLRADANRVRVAQAAIPPRKPSFPQPKIVIPLCMLLVFGLTLGWIFFRELTDQRVKSTSDLSVIPGARILGSIPDLEDDPTRSKSADLVVREHPQSVLAESYRQATNVMCREIERHGHQSMLMFSAMPGAGTTTVLSNITWILAAMGKRVCVIDANFRRPRLAQVFGVEDSQVGFGDLLGGHVSLDDVKQEVAEGICLITAGTPSERIIERLSSDRLSSILAELRSHYDLVLFDTPPSIVAGDSQALASRVDAAVLVIRANREQKGLVARLINQYADGSCNLIGLLLNRPLTSAGGYFKKNYAVMAKYGFSKAT